MSCKFECAICMDRRCCFECEDKRCQYKCAKIFDEKLNLNNYIKCSDYIGDEEKQIDYEAVKTETVNKDFTETIYFVKLKEKYVQDLYNYNTKIANGFAGVIVNQTMSNIYFELKDTKELVIIPYEYVLWLAPIKEK